APLPSAIVGKQACTEVTVFRNGLDERQRRAPAEVLNAGIKLAQGIHGLTFDLGDQVRSDRKLITTVLPYPFTNSVGCCPRHSMLDSNGEVARGLVTSRRLTLKRFHHDLAHREGQVRHESLRIRNV